MKELNQGELLVILEHWRMSLHKDWPSFQLDWIKEHQRAYNQIVAILKNQPTITKKDIKGWAYEAWDRVGDSLGYAEEHIEDVMKEMLTEIGVIICPEKSTTIDKEEK